MKCEKCAFVTADSSHNKHCEILKVKSCCGYDNCSFFKTSKQLRRERKAIDKRFQEMGVEPKTKLNKEGHRVVTLRKFWELPNVR
ncbi:MAG: hypothetical protein LUC25_01110 [Ruminococcus sp.]|nr:hypothetical protein [Ruminococcus sp.]